MSAHNGINKILFIIPFSNTDKQNHLYSKLKAQINGAKEAGFEVCYTEYDNSNVYVVINEQKKLIAQNVNTSRNIRVYNAVFKSIKIIIKLYNFDTIFIRRIAAIPSYLYALRFAKKNGINVIVELPTYPYVNERKNSPRRLFYSVVSFLDSTIGRMAEKYINLCAVIGEKTDKVGSVPAININNGVDVNLYPVSRKCLDKSIILIAVASFCYWHGIDRLLLGLKHYYEETAGKVEVKINIVGNSKDGTIDTLKKLTKEYRLQKNVVFHGFKSGNELNEVFAESDIAIASLGLHRKGLITSSTLKVREYCARGLPIVYAGNDPCLDRHSDLFLKICEDESPIDIDEIVNYANKFRGKESLYHKMIRNVATEEMSWKNEFIAINDCLSRISKR